MRPAFDVNSSRLSLLSLIALIMLGLGIGCSNSDFAGGTSKKSGSKSKDGTDAGDTDDDQDDDQDDDVNNDDDPNKNDVGSEDDGADDDDIGDDGDDVLADENLSCDKGKPGLVGKLYRLPPGTKSLPNFTSMKPEGQVESPKLDVPEREWTQGFPGVPDLDEWFAIEFFASLEVPEDGSYKFRTHSDDGSKLFIDGSTVVDNDGTHGPSSKDGTKTLTKGKHKIKVEWFQGPRTKIALQVYWTKPGGTEEIIPSSALTRNKDCDLKDLGKFE